jgi:hypothetical protein
MITEEDILGCPSMACAIGARMLEKGFPLNVIMFFIRKLKKGEGK